MATPCYASGRGGPSSGSVQAEAARSVAFLNAIETTVSHVSTNAEFLGTLVRELTEFERCLEAGVGDVDLDPDGRASELLSKGAATAHRIYEDAKRRRDAARADFDLRDDDGVVEAWADLIAVAADAHNAIERIRNAIETLDARRSPVVGSFTSVEQLIASLKA